MTPRQPGEMRPLQGAITTCSTCGKRSFLSRRDARRASRALYPEEALRAYACGGYWHIGHTAPWRKRGEGMGKA